MKTKYFANKGVERNKKPLQNKIIWITIIEGNLSEKYEQYKFKDLGYLELQWQYEKNYNQYQYKNNHGFITPERLKNILGEKQWAKFCNGKREFVIQRRFDGKNIKLNF